MQEPISDEQLDAIEQRAQAASETWAIEETGSVAVGPQDIAYGNDNGEVIWLRLADGHFVKHARDDVLRLIAEVRRLNSASPPDA